MGRINKTNLDKFLIGALVLILIGHYANFFSLDLDRALLIFFTSMATFPVLISAFQALKNRKITIDLLASVALVVSILNKEWASAAFISLMLASARVFTAYAENKSRGAIKHLLKLKPTKVKVKRGDEIEEISYAKIEVGDLVIIEMGERIPVDGIILNGEALIDQSSLTGESAPVEKKIGSHVLNSTLNISGSLIVQTEKTGKDTTFEKIIKLVEQSQKEKVGIQTMADKFASGYVIFIILSSVALLAFSRDWSLVLGVLLVTCADDIAVAVPMVFSAAIGMAAKRGIIIKGGSFLEGLTEVKTIIFDKTGTLTRGKMKTEEFNFFPDNQITEKELIGMAAGLDFFSSHPSARAIVNYAKEQQITFGKPDKFEEFSGKGSRAIYGTQEIICGRLSFLEEKGVEILKSDREKIIQAQESGSSLVMVGCNKKLAGYFRLVDEIRPEAKEALVNLKSLGVSKSVMLTGDNEKVAKRVASEVGIEIYHANLLPKDKLNFVKKYIGQKGKVVMVGDGVNDAASLTLADIGIAMGAIGTDAAIEAADVALMKDNLAKIPEALRIGQLAKKVAKQDFWIWGAVNAGGLALVFFRIIGPEGAAAFNFVTDFFPIFNSLRLFLPGGIKRG
ncbi:MAG: cation-translocating P-type ATPase [Candidatus Moraniibacteriota bacterium]